VSPRAKHSSGVSHERGWRMRELRGSVVEITILLNSQVDPLWIPYSIEQNVQFDGPSPSSSACCMSGKASGGRLLEPPAGSHCELSQGSCASPCALIRIHRAYDRIRQAWTCLPTRILAVFAVPISQPQRGASVFAK
jgi:hypothetical protein